MRASLAALVFLAAVGPAGAATLVYTVLSGDRSAIRLEGDIERGDDVRFLQMVEADPRPVALILSSEGGNFAPVMAIGNAVHRLGLVTIVPPKATCASACADIWIAGGMREIAATGRVGFHQMTPNRAGAETGLMTVAALTGAYYARLGLNDATITFAMSKPPNDMAWLTPADSQRLGLDVLMRDEGSPPSTGGPPKPVPKAPVRQRVEPVLTDRRSLPATGSATPTE